jgi:hypothetical protein
MSSKKVLFMKTPMCTVYGWGQRRDYFYENGCSLTRNDNRYVLCGTDETLLHEIAYTTLLSAVGEKLDQKKYHRVHALGLSYADRATIIILDSGQGKSSLASTFLYKSVANPHQQIKIYSDESPLIKNRKLYPFPLRIALRENIYQLLKLSIPTQAFKRKLYSEKLTFNIPPSRIAEPRPIAQLLIGRMVLDSVPEICPINRIRASFAILRSLVVGIGLTQMKEHMLGWHSIPRLVQIFFSRLQEARKLSSVPVYFFTLNQFPEENAKVLRDFCGGQTVPTKTGWKKTN